MLRFFLLVLSQRDLRTQESRVKQGSGVDLRIASPERFHARDLVLGGCEIAFMHQRLCELEVSTVHPEGGRVGLRSGDSISQKTERLRGFSEPYQRAPLVVSV